MRLSHSPGRTTIHLRSIVALATTAVLVTACGDSTLAPAKQRGLVDRPVLARYHGGFTFTYDPREGATTTLGRPENSISMPAWSVCDPATSSYGPGTWDQPCRALNRTIDITVKTYTDANGHPYLEFTPALRFVPSQVVTLTISDKKASADASTRITYCPDAGPCIDEGSYDPSLSTQHNYWTGRQGANAPDDGTVRRRVKHFSGYNVAAGDEGDGRAPDSPDASLSRGTLGLQMSAMRARSGYMVVSGVESTDQSNTRPPDRDDRH